MLQLQELIATKSTPIVHGLWRWQGSYQDDDLEAKASISETWVLPRSDN